MMYHEEILLALNLDHEKNSYSDRDSYGRQRLRETETAQGDRDSVGRQKQLTETETGMGEREKVKGDSD